VIVVDTSIWVDFFKGIETEKVQLLVVLIRTERLIVGDLILCEVLQGTTSDVEAARVSKALLNFQVVSLVDTRLAIKAAANYRLLRSKGITVRKTIDLVIGTFCIERGHALLHADRDFEPMSLHLGLRTA
jgi:predicted nucleic acid-binding protein